MARIEAATAEEYLARAPTDQQEPLRAVRAVIAAHLPEGYVEAVAWGMLAWVIPLERFPNTYNRQPLCAVALAAQKRYCSLYLMGCYGSEALETRLRAAFEAAGLKLDMGKACVRFQTAADLPLAAIGEIVADLPPEELIAAHERVHRARDRSRGRS